MTRRLICYPASMKAAAAGLLALTAAISLAIPPARLPDHIWSKQGKAFYLVAGNEDVGHIKSSFAYSPDHSRWLRLDFVKGHADGDAIPEVTLVSDSGKILVPLDRDWAQVEILWSPDSTSFALTGAPNAYTNSARIFRIADGSIKRIPLDSVWRDMAATYPTCKAANADPVDCRRAASGKYFNYAVVAWSNPRTVVIMSEVPCSSSWGGIMCAVEAYQFDTATQMITARISPREFKRNWQPYLAWTFRIPDPPIWKPSDKTVH